MIEAIRLSHGRATICGVAYYGSNQKNALTVILLHGLTGVDRNCDLAQELQAHGCNAFILYFRGSWCDNSRLNLLDQTKDLEFALKELDRRRLLNVDAKQVVILAYSFGTRAAIEYCTSHEVARLILLGAIAEFHKGEFTLDLANKVTSVLNRGNPLELQKQWDQLARLEQPFSQIQRIPNDKIVLVHGSEDSSVPYSHAIKLHDAAPGSRLITIDGAGHEFVGYRENLRATVVAEILERT